MGFESFFCSSGLFFLLFIRYIVKGSTVARKEGRKAIGERMRNMNKSHLQTMLEKKEFERLYTANYTAMIRFARTLLHDEDESRDAVADVMLRVYTKGIPNEHAPVKYLLACVRNKCLDTLRQMTIRQKVEKMLPVEDTMIPADPDEQQNLHLLIMQVMENDFPPQTKNVFKMRFDQRLSYQEIADRLHISKAAVYKHLAKAISILKSAIPTT